MIRIIQYSHINEKTQDMTLDILDPRKHKKNG